MLSKIEELIYGVTFDPASKRGKVIVNLSLVEKQDLDRALEIFSQVMYSGIAVSPLVKIVEEGEGLGDQVIEKGKVGILTICSLTMDGVLLKAGIPSRLKCGGIVQVRNREPVRFTDLLMYVSTTLDPLEVFTFKNSTSVLQVITTGSGKILANLREVPMSAREDVEGILEDLVAADFKGVLAVGEPNMPLLDVPVGKDRVGIAIIGGYNLVAAAFESDIKIQSKAISHLVEVSEMRPLI
jgi:repressor of nif and glnA expression